MALKAEEESLRLAAAERKEEDEVFADSVHALKRLKSRMKQDAANNSPGVRVTEATPDLRLNVMNLDPDDESEEDESMPKIALTKKGPNDSRKSFRTSKGESTSKILETMGFSQNAQGKPSMRRYVRRGHMPPILRRASYYERVLDE